MKRLLYILFCCQPVLGWGQVIETWAGNGQFGYTGDGGLAINATIGPVGGGIFDRRGNYYMPANSVHSRVRMIDTNGIIHTIAGTGSNGYNGDNILAAVAQLNLSVDVAVDPDGNIFIPDFKNYRIRKIDANTGIITTIAGNGISGSTGDGGLAISATVIPTSICFDKLGTLYFADSFTRIRRIDTNGNISTIAGNGVGVDSGDGGLAINASLAINYSICCDKYGNIYVACASRVRKIDIMSGIITTVAGNGVAVYNGDEIPATSAQISPMGISIDDLGNLYIADYVNDRIRKVDNQGIIHTVAGTGVGGFTGDFIVSTSAQVNHPFGVTVDSCGNIYIADQWNYRIRKVSFNPHCWPLHVNEIKPLTFTLSPNPATSQITITGSNTLKEITICNTLGQPVLHQTCNSSSPRVDIEHLPAGVYFINVVGLSGSKRTEKIIKQ